MKKIMFNDRYGLTKAVLEGRKTQTRRIVPRNFFSLTWDEKDGTLVYENDMGDFIDVRNSAYALYKVGEVVAVAQSYKDAGFRPDKVLYRSIPQIDGYKKELASEQKGWLNKMFVCANLMPHHIRITNMHIERLQDISDEDCIAEGISYIKIIERYYFERKDKQQGFYFNSAKSAFAALIDKVSGKRTWESNPYVFVYDFELEK